MAVRPLPAPELLRQLIDYDPETGGLLWRKRDDSLFTTGHRNAIAWNVGRAGGPALSNTDRNGYKWGLLLGARVRSHRAIWALMTNEWPTAQIDHINGDRADNRWINLRQVSNAVNARNKTRHRFNTSGHNGVSWDRGCQKWRVHIGLDGKIRYVGVYAELNDAIAARRRAEAGHGFTERHGKA